MSADVQGELSFRPWGGARRGAGRKPRVAGKPGLPHTTRPRHHSWNPLHITVRTVRLAPNLRAAVVFRIVEREIRGASRRGLRIVHFSVQSDHVHMIVEAADGRSLWRGLQRFESRVAMEINRVTGRSGKLWRERYHRRDLASPSQVRNALVYVLMKCSSVAWFTGWHPAARPPPRTDLRAPDDPPPTVAPETWLLNEGWKPRGPLHLEELPRTPW